MTNANLRILTIGHSNHSLEAFLARLSQHDVTAVADVRSAPYSRFCPHFNRDVLTAALKACGIRYSYLGRELGGRSDDPACYEGGQIQYELVARTSVFREGLARVVGGAATWRVALMCAEKEPLDCHRTLLVARALVAAGVDVVHILADGELETHARTMDRLLAELSPNYDLFQPREELLARALALQARRIAFVSKDSDTTSRSRRGHSVTPTTMKAGTQGPPAGDDSPRSRRGHSVTPTTMRADRDRRLVMIRAAIPDADDHESRCTGTAG